MAFIDPLKRDFSRQLRKDQTDAEKKLWTILRSRQLNGFKFRRQHVIKPYVIDFCCLNPKMGIELDGAQHQDARIQDQVRTEYLQKKGFKILRFWNSEVMKEPQAVSECILSALTLALSHPADRRGK